MKTVGVTLSSTTGPSSSLKYWLPLEGAGRLRFSSPSRRPRLQKGEIPGPRVRTFPHAAPIRRAEELPQVQRGGGCQGLGGEGKSKSPPAGVGFIVVGTKLFSAVLVTIT